MKCLDLGTVDAMRARAADPLHVAGSRMYRNGVQVGGPRAPGQNGAGVNARLHVRDRTGRAPGCPCERLVNGGSGGGTRLDGLGDLGDPVQIIF